MVGHGRCISIAATVVMIIPFTIPVPSLAQDAPSDQRPSAADSGDDVKALGALVRQLQNQVASLSTRVQTLEVNEKAARAESANLREQLAAAKVSVRDSNEAKRDSGVQAYVAEANTSGSAAQANPQGTALQVSDERISALEENVELANAKIKEQSQTKVESSSKYRVRLSGLALFNLFANRGTVDNQDIPQIAKPAGLFDSSGTFGGSLRQSQIGLEAFGPDIAGARTSAEIRFDFAGGFPPAPNGDLNGLVRLRTGTVRFDWSNTSIIAGQDYLFFSPLTPTSYGSLAIPALSYSGNLWGWTPQVRVEHRFVISDASSVSVQAGVLETLSGDTHNFSYERSATWGERSGGPGTAARVAWRRSAFGQSLVVGVGGYYGRQTWGFGRDVDSWAG